MDILEKELEDMVYLSSQEKIREKGLDCYSHTKLFRQLNLGAYGVPDIIGVNSHITNRRLYYTITIYELKKGTIGLDTLAQGARYLAGVEEFLKSKKISYPADVRVVLIGDSLDLNGSFVYACRMAYSISLYTYSFGIDGLEFECHNPYNFAPTRIEECGYGQMGKLNLKGLHKTLYREAK